MRSQRTSDLSGEEQYASQWPSWERVNCSQFKLRGTSMAPKVWPSGRLQKPIWVRLRRAAKTRPSPDKTSPDASGALIVAVRTALSGSARRSWILISPPEQLRNSPPWAKAKRLPFSWLRPHAPFLVLSSSPVSRFHNRTESPPPWYLHTATVLPSSATSILSS